MDQDILVSDQAEGGKRLIEMLAKTGFEVRVAFWGKRIEADKWYLYIASPFVDERGPAAAYRSVQDILRNTPELGIEPLEVKLVGLNDSITEAILAIIKRKVAHGSSGVETPKYFPGMTRFGGYTLGRLNIDVAYIYPSPQPAASA